MQSLLPVEVKVLQRVYDVESREPEEHGET